jgi:hypothetical protein
LIPPSEQIEGRCSRAVESPITSFSEADYFSGGLGLASCLDYAGWAGLIGRLAQQYPHLVAVNIDDFSQNLDPAFTPELLAVMTSRMREQAPWLSLVPTFYYDRWQVFVGDVWPDVGLSLDSILFYFRNEKQGGAPCATCEVPDPTRCADGCLEGTCAEATVVNLPGEIADVVGMLPPDRKLQVGAYFTPHSTCGEGSAKYDYDLLLTALSLPAVGGVHVYTTHYPAIVCTDENFLDDKGCVVERVFGSH